MSAGLLLGGLCECVHKAHGGKSLGFFAPVCYMIQFPTLEACSLLRHAEEVGSNVGGLFFTGSGRNPSKACWEARVFFRSCRPVARSVGQ